MPSMNQGGSQRGRSRFDNDPADEAARFLDWDVIGTGSKSVDGRERMVRDRIDGIDRIEVVRAWIAVERRLGRGPDGGPRPGIVSALEAREQRLREIGERPERLPHGPREACECCRRGEEGHAEGLRAQRQQRRERRAASWGSSYDGPEEVESAQTTDSTLGQFATDGGEDQ